MRDHTSDSADDSQIDTDEADVTPMDFIRPMRLGAAYSPQARQRIEYLQELRRLRSQIGDDALDDF